MRTSTKYLIFCHGWGFSPAIFYPFAEYFKTYTCLFWDLGYFSNPRFPWPEDDNAEIIGIGHSLGMAKLLTHEQAYNFTAIIGLKSFLYFLGFNAKLNKIRGLALAKMQNDFIKSPKATLNQFYSACGMELVNTDLNSTTLEQDLIFLTTPQKALNCPILIIGSEYDTIVPKVLIEDNFHNLKNAKLIFNNSSYHGIDIKQQPSILSHIEHYLCNMSN